VNLSYYIMSRKDQRRMNKNNCSADEDMATDHLFRFKYCLHTMNAE